METEEQQTKKEKQKRSKEYLFIYNIWNSLGHFPTFTFTFHECFEKLQMNNLILPVKSKSFITKTR